MMKKNVHIHYFSSLFSDYRYQGRVGTYLVPSGMLSPYHYGNEGLVMLL